MEKKTVRNMIEINKMIRTILSVLLLTHTTLAQFMDSLKPDMSFNENNDRFDISSMMRAQKIDTPLIDDDDDGVASDADTRRHLQNDDTTFLDILQQKRTDTRRADAIDFAYDPDNLPKIGRAGNDEMLDLEFQENLRHFAKNIAKPGRRNAPDEDHEGEVLMQNVVPIVMKVDGFLRAPLEELRSDKATEVDTT